MATLAKLVRGAIVASVVACGSPGGRGASAGHEDMDRDYGFVGSGGNGLLDGGRSLDDGGSIGMPDAASQGRDGSVDSGSVVEHAKDGGVADLDASAAQDGGSGVGVVVNTESSFFVFLDWSITGPDGSYSGRVYFGDARSIEFVVGGIDAGSGYTITLKGTDRDGQPCTGTSASFDVMAGVVTGAPVTIACPVPTDSGGVVITDS